MLQKHDLIIIPTRQCNLSCAYCPVDKREESLDPESALRAALGYADAGGSLIRLTGGEPLLEWPLIEKMVRSLEARESRPRPVAMEICTNGLLLDRSRVEFLSRPWITLVVSMDGDMKTCIRNRLGSEEGVDRFLQLIEITRILAKQGRHFVTQTVAPAAEREAAENFFFIWDQGVRNINFLPVFYKKWSASNLRALKNDLFDIASFLKPYMIDRQCRVRNVEKRGMIPLFGNAICLDTDEKFYYTNAIILKKLRAVKQQLKIADSLDDVPGCLAGFIDGHRAARVIQSRYSPEILRSNRKVDALLTAFVRELQAPRSHRAVVGRQGSRPERLELHLSYRCTNDCIFCSERRRLERFQGRDVSAVDAWRALERHRSAGGSHVNFTGGEPTIHPSFISLLEGARNLGLRVYVGTNGVMMGREDFAARAAGLIDELSLSVHGPDAAIHESGTRKAGSFADIVGAAALARKYNPRQQLMANMVVTRINFDHMLDTIRLCADMGVSQVLLSNPSPEGRAKDLYEDLVVPLERWKGAVGPAAEKADELGLILRFFGLPACALGEYSARSNDFFFDPRITVERTRRGGGRSGLSTIITRHPRRGRRKVKACRRCRYNDLCGGIFGDYVKIYKEEKIDPIEG